MFYLFKAMRPHQWAKGVFILLPLVFGQKLLDQAALTNTLLMLGIFSFAASAMYLINDMIDLEEDKNHPEKCKRPLASGKVTHQQVKVTATTLLIVSVSSAFMFKATAGILLISYLSLNYAYMRYLKHAVILDVFCIAGFFYLRILAGGIASDVVLSEWIIMCTVLLALFIGLNKRRYDYEFSKKYRSIYTKYDKYFLDRMISIVAPCLLMSYSLYIIDPTTIARFGTNKLFFSVPFVYYGIFRYIYLIETKWFGGDPAKILFRDYKIQINMALWLIVCVSVIYIT